MIKIKKLFKTFVITCFLFICFITTAKADNSVIIQRQGDYNNLNCDASIKKLENFNVKSDAYIYEFTLKPGVDGKVTEKITCSFSGGGSKVGEGKSGKVSFSLTANGKSDGIMEYNFQMSGDINKVYDMMNATGADVIKNFKWVSGSQYVKTNGCNGTSVCTFSPVETNDGKNTHTTEFTFTMMFGDREVNAKAIMEVTFIGTIGAHPGGLGTCTMPESDWDASHIDGTWTNMQGITKRVSYYLSKRNTNVKFGSCTPNDPNLVKFVGWAPAEGNEYFDSGEGQLVGVCSSMKGLVPGNTTAKEPKMYYSACYEYVPLVKITGLMGGKLTGDTAGWTSTGTGSYINKKSGKVKLPGLSFESVNKTNGTNYIFVGWTTVGSSNVIKAGTEVDADGRTYTPVINRTETEIDYFKNVYFEETFNLQVTNATGCSLGSGASTYVTAEFSNGTCKVKGIKITEGDQNAPVVVQKTDGLTVTYKFKVLSKVGVSGYVYQDGIPIIEPGVVAGKNDTYTTAHGNGTGEMIEDTRCNTYLAEYIGESGEWNTDGMRSGVYNIKCKEPADTLSGVIALCLDPGLMGPGKDDNVLYVKSFDVAAGSDFSKLLNYISDRIAHESINMGSKNDTKRIAFHIAVRIVGLKYFDNGHIGPLRDNYKTYSDASDELPKRGEITTPIATKIANKMKFKDTDSANAIKNELIKVLTEYRKYDEGTEKTTNEKFVNIVNSVYKEVKNSNSYWLTYEGKFTLPKGATNVVVHNGCNGSSRGYSCDVDTSYTKTLAEPDEFGRVQVQYKIVIKVPNAGAVEPITSSKGKDKAKKSIYITWEGKTSAQVSILQPTQSDGSSFQRMVSVDPKSDHVYLYLPPGTGNAKGMCEGTVSLNPDNCTSESSCSNFNQDLYVHSGCCAFLENEGTYVAKSVCNGTCVESTMQSTCQFLPKDSSVKVEDYEIKEGAFVTDDGKLHNSIGTCVVNVSAYDSENPNLDTSQFYKKDSAGNSIMISEYEDNRYCKVSCKEDFMVSLGAFGNYVGTATATKKGAVAAGTFFNLDDDIYMGGKRSCYTTFIDYNKYLNDLVIESGHMADGFSVAFLNSMRYSDLDKDKEGGVEEEDTKTFCVSSLSTCSCTDYPCDKNDDKVISEGETCTCHCTDYTTVSEVDGAHNNPTNGQKYCPSGSDTYEAHYYDIVMNGDWDTEGSTTHTINPQDSQFSQTETDKKNDGHEYKLDTEATPVDGNANYKVDNTDVFNCKGADGHGKSQPEVCKSKTASEVWSKKGERLSNGYQKASAGGRGTMAAAQSAMKNYAEQFFDCQHFQLNPTEIGEKANNAIQTGVFWGNPNKGEDGKYHGSSRGYVQIDSKFNPTATYTYDEKTMMDIIGPDNEVEEYIAKNNQVMPNYYTRTNDKETKNGVTLYRNYVTYGYYLGNGSNHNKAWDKNSTQAKEYYSSYGYTLEGSAISNMKSKTTAVEDAKVTGDSNIPCDQSDEKVAGGYCKKRIVICSISAKSSGGSSTVATEVKEGAMTSVTVGGGGADYHWYGGDCYVSYAYYKKANYVTTSISNSSLYRNKGSWVQSTVTGAYEHGLSLEGGKSLVRSALEKAKNNRKVSYDIDKELSGANGGGVVGSWRLIGVMDNVFPVSFITPRNLYTYTYTFSNVGMYGDGSLRGKLGRILGDDNAVIRENKRTCFYEVYESTCICCGAERIDAYAGIYKNNSTTNAELSYSEKVVNEFVQGHDDVKKVVSDKDAMTVNDSGVIGFDISTVATGDLNGAPNRDLASNFGDYTFTYENGTYKTQKGEAAKMAIEAQAENLYNEEPEYIYTLTPTAIKDIQDYNKSHPYGIDSATVKVYSQNTIVPTKLCSGSDCKWTDRSMGKEENYVSSYVTFAHIGSGFLEDFASNYVPAEYKNKVLSASKEVCTISAEEAKNPDSIRKKVKDEKCRWVDYIEDYNVVHGNRKVPTYNNVSNSLDRVTQVPAYFRLAYK